MKSLWQELNAANLSIANAIGYAPDYIRVPGGTTGIFTKEFPMPLGNWDVDSLDYKNSNQKDGGNIIYNRLVNSGIRDGSIILMHSIYFRTYDATAMLLEYLSNQGYVFVTLSELFYYKGITPEDGEVYRNAVAAEQ